MKDFRIFVAQQVARCEALPSGKDYLFSEAAQREIVDWLEHRAGENPSGKKPFDMDWLRDSMPARKVKAVIDQCMEGDLAPTIPAVRAVWFKLHGDKPKVNEHCRQCDGTGWKVVKSGDTEGVARCPNGCSVPSDTMKTISPAQRNREDAAAYSKWARELEAELRGKMKKRLPPPLPYLPPIPEPVGAEK